MPDRRNELARNVADALFAGERAIDAAVIDLARLPVSIANVRLEAELPFGLGQGALSDAAEALNLLIRARHHMARAHDRLREAGSEIGFDAVAFGDVFPCPDVATVVPEAPAPAMPAPTLADAASPAAAEAPAAGTAPRLWLVA